MAPTVGLLTARGAMFRKPPPTYYDLQVGDTWYIFFGSFLIVDKLMKWLQGGGGEGKESIHN